jgi:heme exporter protein A
MSDVVLQAQRIAKFFGDRPVLHGIDFTARAGQAAVIVGRNGVGKSTLIRVFCGLARPSAGRLLLFGRNPVDLAAEQFRRLGVLLHHSLLYPNLSARENLEFYGEIYGIAEPAACAAQWLRRIGLERFADDPVTALSRGMEQRLARRAFRGAGWRWRRAGRGPDQGGAGAQGGGPVHRACAD